MPAIVRSCFVECPGEFHEFSQGIRHILRMAAEADDAFRDRDIQRDLNECTVFQVILDEIFDDAADSESDPGEFDEEFHVGGLQDLVDLDLVVSQVGVHMFPAHIGAV